MTTATQTSPRTLADLARQFGDIAPHRIRLNPPPGRAGEQDMLDAHDHENSLAKWRRALAAGAVRGA